MHTPSPSLRESTLATLLLLSWALSPSATLAQADPAAAQRNIEQWLTSTILTARRQLSWPVEAGNEFNALLA